MAIFSEYHWPGNVRELENMVRRMVVLATSRRSPGDRTAGSPHTDHDDRGDFLDLEALSVDLANGRAWIEGNPNAQRGRRKEGDRAGAPADALESEGGRRTASDQLALLYKMKEGGLNDDR
jgi:transcriptional regulator with GAF, ATPase, and Fis domain